MRDLQHRFETLGGYTLDQRVEEALSGLGFSAADLDAPPVVAVRRRADAGGARPARRSPTPTCSCSTSPRTTSTSARWSGWRTHLRRRQGSLLVASHDRAFLDATVTPDLGAPRPPARPSSGATTAAYHRQREERDASRRKDADTQAAADRARAGARPAVPEPPQVLQDARARGAAGAAPGATPDGRRRRRAARAPGHGAASAAARARSGEIVDPPRGTSMAATAARAARPARSPILPSARRAARRTDRDRGAERRRQDDAAAHHRRATCLPLDGSFAFGHRRASSATSPSFAAAADPGHDGAGRAARGRAGHARRGARLPRPVPVPRRRRVQGGPRRSPAASARGWSWRCWASCPRTCYCSTSPRTTWTSPPARRSRRSCGRRRPRCSSCPTTGGCSRRSASGCGWSTTGAVAAPFDGGYRAMAGVAMADGRGRRHGRSTAERRDACAWAAPRQRSAGQPRSGGAAAGRLGPRPSRARAEAAGRPRQRTATAAPRRAGRAVEGCLPAAERQGRGGHDAAGPAQEPAGARPGGPAVQSNFVELRRSTSELADVERRPRPGRGAAGSRRGARAVSVVAGAAGVAPPRSRCASASPARSAAASPRLPAGCAELGAVVIDADQWRARSRRRHRGHDAVLAAFGAVRGGPTAASIGPRWAVTSSSIPTRCAGWSRSSTRRPAADPRGASTRQPLRARPPSSSRPSSSSKAALARSATRSGSSRAPRRSSWHASAPAGSRPPMPASASPRRPACAALPPGPRRDSSTRAGMRLPRSSASTPRLRTSCAGDEMEAAAPSCQGRRRPEIAEPAVTRQR